jgi:hypothetical protein
MRDQKQTSDRARIRELFLQPRESYTVAEAAYVLRMPPDGLLEAIAAGNVEAEDYAGETCLSWNDVVALAAVERWPPRIISEALPRELVPRLARGVRAQVNLPRYLWKLLRIVAMERAEAADVKLTLSDMIEEAIHHTHVASITDWSPFEEQIPGVRAAMKWPLV